MAKSCVVVHPKLNLGKGRLEVGTEIKLDDDVAEKWIKQGKVKLAKSVKSIDATKKK